jgi:hypothetical protein
MARKKRKIAVIDAETDPFERGIYPEPFIFGFYDGETYEEFTDPSALVEFLSAQDLIVYGHNAGKFDYFFLLPYLEAFSEIMIINGRLSRFKIGDCEFRDSYNILPIAMAQYQKMSFDYSVLHKDKRNLPGNMERIKKYLYSDCVNQFDLVSKFIERFGMNLTLAGAAMKTWAKMTGNTPPRSSPQFYDNFHPFYYGGRVEAFRPGYYDCRFKLVDINSAYPWAMLKKHPFSVTYSFVDCSLETLLTDYETDLINPSFFVVSAISNGAFPYRGDDKTLTFPNDNTRRVYFVTGWELLAAVETKTAHGIELKGGYIFDEFIDFSDYITPFYEERKTARENGDKAGDIFSKLFMNTLYGKWASNPASYGNYVIAPHEYGQMIHNGIDYDALSEDDRGLFGALAGYELSGELGEWAILRQDLDDEQQRYYNIATAASITGCVRAHLWRNICKCQGVLYCDTDSIAAEEIGDIKISKELGDWGIDGEFIKAAISGKKLYAFRHAPGTEPRDSEGRAIKWKTASKGVRIGARQLIAVARGREVLYTPESPTYSVHSGPRFTPRRVRATAKIGPK